MNPANLNSLWGNLIVEELIRNKINYFVLSPGSRSTPLTVAVARHPQAEKIICYDERGAAFHALGYARATGNPAVLICTSGTAAANYFPAVIEAAVEHIPMVIFSADRPPELRQTGANQTIQQVNLYGEYARWQFDLPCPDDKIPPQVLLTTVDQAVYQARRSPCGVVHINCMFREPLAPTKESFNQEYLISVEKWLKDEQVYTHNTSSVHTLQEEELKKLAKLFQKTSTGILVIGQLKSPDETEAVIKLANKLNWSVFADIQSGMRLSKGITHLIHYFDQLLLREDWHQGKPWETVFQIGDRLISKRWLQLIEKYPPQDYIVLLNHPSRHDPTHRVTWRLEGDISYTCEQLCQELPQGKTSTWTKSLQRQSQQINQTIDDFLFSSPAINEPALARLISRHIPPQNGLFLASSMAVRLMDMYATPQAGNIVVAANRGASGIEGTIACAAGFAVGLAAPVILLIGDLACFHDLNSLYLLKSIPQPVIVVIINNGGGGIFSFLPIAEFKDVFETYFATPHQLKFRQAAQMFNLDYYHPQTLAEFTSTYQAAIQSQVSTVIEVTTNREDNWALQQELQREISGSNSQNHEVNSSKANS